MTKTHITKTKKFKFNFHVNVPLLLLLSLLYIAIGDRILPQPIGKFSTQARTAINQAMTGSFPGWRPKTNPYKRTNDAIEREQKSGENSPK